mmetsp:Transcript_25931/g.49173  ORF Transcript_25931/g.49173 Transcript_25931/m.49173 type:complete len:101 (-) Transcript_25931:12-314(-)
MSVSGRDKNQGTLPTTICRHLLALADTTSYSYLAPTHLFTKSATDAKRSGTNHPRDRTADDCMPANDRDSFGQEHDSNMQQNQTQGSSSHGFSSLILVMA